MDKKEKKEILVDKIAGLKRLCFRYVDEIDGDFKKRWRNDFQRDYARLLYSSSFRRLQGKMQMLGVNSSRYYRNRLTHSLEVAQIARSICTTMSRKYDRIHFWSFMDLFLIETICLAHDLGNPPFGHAGEVVLNDLADDYGGFEGNAQTYRILRRLERKFIDHDGLNLTKRTMLGVVKYHKKRTVGEEVNNKFLYDEDYDEVTNIKTDYSISDDQTLDCQVMDLADEIAYGAHDLEDALHQRFINPYDLVFMFKKEVRQKEKLGNFPDEEIDFAVDELQKQVSKSLNYAYKCDKGDSDDIFETIFRRELSSRLVNLLVNDIDYDDEKDRLCFLKYGALSKGLKVLLFNAIKNDSEDILVYERVGEKVLRKLYDAYMDDSFNKKNALLSAVYRDFSDDDQRKRRIVDYLSGMMDSYAIEVYEKIIGKNPFKGVYEKISI